MIDKPLGCLRKMASLTLYVWQGTCESLFPSWVCLRHVLGPTCWVTSHGACLFLPASLRVILSRSIRVAAEGVLSLCSMAEQYSTVYIQHIFFTHPSVHGHLGGLHAVAAVNRSINTLSHLHSSHYQWGLSPSCPEGWTKVWGAFFRG